MTKSNPQYVISSDHLKTNLGYGEVLHIIGWMGTKDPTKSVLRKVKMSDGHVITYEHHAFSRKQFELNRQWDQGYTTQQIEPVTIQWLDYQDVTHIFNGERIRTTTLNQDGTPYKAACGTGALLEINVSEIPITMVTHKWSASLETELSQAMPSKAKTHIDTVFKIGVVNFSLNPLRAQSDNWPTKSEFASYAESLFNEALLAKDAAIRETYQSGLGSLRTSGDDSSSSWLWIILLIAVYWYLNRDREAGSVTVNLSPPAE